VRIAYCVLGHETRNMQYIECNHNYSMEVQVVTKKLIIGFTVLVLLVSGTSVAFGRGVSGVEGKVTAYGLNVRTGPGVAYSIIGVLSQGDAVKVVGKNATGPSIDSGHSDWLQIAYSGQGELNGQEGWIAAAYVDLAGSLAAVSEVSAPPPPTAAMAGATIAAQAAPTPNSELTGKLVFQVCNGCDIYVIKADGSGLRRLTDGMDPAWSPDGKKVAFARWRDPRGIYVIDEDGSNETLLFGWSQAKAPAWSPDSRHIAFFTDRNGKWELYVMNADGSNQRPVFEPAPSTTSFDSAQDKLRTGLDSLQIEYGFVSERMVSWTK